MRLQTDAPWEHYLQSTPLIDWDHPEIAAWIAAYGPEGRDETQIVRDAFQFVRDQIAHSCDVQNRMMTAKASEVLRFRVGMCYAKSHLLAALLRGMGIPADLGYQKLTLGRTAESGYCIHALNTVYLSAQKQWRRVDARGNKSGVNAQFWADREQLAFPIRPEYGEVDYSTNYPETPHEISATLAAHQDCLEMCAEHLPTKLEKEGIL